ncbi:PAS domain S-box protein [Sulfurimonas aquatica]|uniref:histidine kinase n=1 Tax=Sulfurimonas aquatica TaxID=2672570 RepID=A0A975AZK8_9BACT|nr:PAS domain S-box protein [Sulfurimonas aquatica]QSZ41410.1 PAS domain S-box protein [Sulfurimonas aquatica]
MNPLATDSLRKKVILSIIVSMFLLLFIAISITVYIEESTRDEHKSEYHEQIQRSINYSIKYHQLNFTYRIKRLIDTTNIVELFQSKDREAAHAALQKSWNSFREEEPSVDILHILDANGNSFLRMHKPELFGDDLTQVRPMIKEITNSHKIITGYETGKHATVFRVMIPIFDKQNSYIGAIEVGVNPNFLIDSIEEITGFEGLVFIDKVDLKTFNKPTLLNIAQYGLISNPTPHLSSLIKAFTAHSPLKDSVEFSLDGANYFTHLFTISDRNNKEKVKLLFFQNLSNTKLFSSYLQVSLAFLLLSLFSFLIWFVYIRINIYQSQVSKIYNKHIQALKESEAKTQAIFEVTPDIMITTDGEHIDTVNPAMLKFFSYESKEDFIAEHDCICDFFLEERGYLQTDMNGIHWLEYIRLNPTKTHRVKMLHEQKEHTFLVWEKELKLDKNRRSVVTLTDITAFEELGYLLNNTINSMDSIFFVKDEQFRYLECNHSMERLIGKSRAEIIGKTDYELFAKEEADFYRAMDEEVFKQEKTLSNFEWVKYPDGRKAYMLTSKSPLKTDDGEIIGLVANTADLTKQKELEGSLKESQALFELFMQNIPAGIIIKDKERHIIYANDPVSKFFDTKDIIGKTAYDLLPSDIADSVSEFEKKIIEDGYAQEIQKMLDAKGKEHIKRVLGFKIEHKDKNFDIGLVCLDITEDYRIKKELQKKDEIMITQSRQAAMGDMIAMIAHQWRQPITVIAMAINNLKVDLELEQEISPAMLHSMGDGILQQTKHLSQTIDDFRNFLKPNKEKESVEVCRVLESALSMISQSLKNNNILLKVDSQCKHKILTYPNELLQVFLNLINNAKDSLVSSKVKDASIEITLREDEGYVITTFCDNGEGIPKEILKHLGEPYVSSKAKSGTGLGLYMSKIIVEKHLQGILTWKNIQRGACFELKIPLQNEETS